jgi:hypothetical protein
LCEETSRQQSCDLVIFPSTGGLFNVNIKKRGKSTQARRATKQEEAKKSLK